MIDFPHLVAAVVLALSISGCTPQPKLDDPYTCINCNLAVR